MATIKFGGGITEMRGSIAGNTFSRNKAGAYVRARTTPINPSTARQSAVRALTALISQTWFAIASAAQRAAWAVFASNMPTTNKVGDVIYISGFNQFMKSNIAAQNAGLTAIADAPVVFTLPGEDVTFSTIVDEATQMIATTFDDAAPWAAEDGGALIVQMGLPQNASIEFFNGPWRHAGAVPGAVIPVTSPQNIAVPFPVAEGQKIFTRARIIRADGRLSDWFRYTSLGTA